MQELLTLVSQEIQSNDIAQELRNSNELHKQPVTVTLANEPKDRCKHQYMLN
jgi:hypothetical protein